MHILGLMGMPRRIYTYPPELGWGGLNMAASIGAAIIALSLFVYLFNIIDSLRHGALAVDNPWGAASLEWATTSPPPPYNFNPGPTVSGRDPLWHDDPDQPVVVGIPADKRKVLVTHVLDAEPDHLYENPAPSIWPFVTAIFVTALFIGSIFTPWAVVYGAIPVFIAMIFWFWPKKGMSPTDLETCIAAGQATPLELTH
jgi:cytochrome c oxidase subunit 1